MEKNLLILNLYAYIYFYIFIFLSFCIFLYIKNFQNFLNNSTDLSSSSTNIYFKIHFWLFTASLIGIPPLLGFFPKLILFITLLNLQKYNFIIIFIILNIFIMIFYLQQIRFIQTKKKKFNKNQKNQKKDIILEMVILTLQLINIFAIIYLPFLMTWFYNNF